MIAVSASGFRTVDEALRERARCHPECRAFTFLQDDATEAEHLTWSDLDRRARTIAAGLQVSCAPGDRALLLFPPGLDFVSAFFGCLYAGIVAVPAYPPRSARAFPRLHGLVADCRPAVAVTTSTWLPRLRKGLANDPATGPLPWLAADALSPLRAWRDPGAGGDDLAFLQYTSGSMSAPKGVMVSHGNLVHNQNLIQEACGHSQDSVFVSWLPLYHDLGLIGQVLQAVWTGASCVLMAPVAFLQRPLRWLEAVSRYRATTSGGPSFAYDLCVRKAAGADLSGLDLSAWRIAFNGAEPVHAATLERFAATFARCGFRAASAYPCYGLAEATLMVSGGDRDRLPAVGRFGAAALAAGRIEAPVGDEPARRLVACGRPLGGQRVAIVDPATGEPLAADREGEIWIAGPSVARGYWGRPEETAATFGACLTRGEAGGEGPFLRTGDLGFLADGELLITGRLKDLIILRGRNLHPQDIERTAEASHPDLLPGGGAAFSVSAEDTERLIVVHEVRRHARATVEEIAAAVRSAVAEEHEAAVAEVVLIRPETLPRTSSGKVRRQACRAAWRAGELSEVGRSRRLVDEADEAALAAAPLRRDTLLSLAPEDRAAVLTGFLRDCAARALRVSPSHVAADRSLAGLGLDSLMAGEIRNEVETALGVSLEIAELLADGTPEDLAARMLEQIGTGSLRPDVPPVTPASALPENAAFPVSFEQERLWFLDQLAPGDPALQIPAVVPLAGLLDLECLERSLRELVRRHASLRTTFAVEQGRPVQRIAPDLALALPVVDLTGLPAPQRRARAERLAAEEAFRPFELSRGPLLRARLLRLDAQEHRLLLTVHHAVCDLGSLVLCVEDLATIYGALAAGAPAPPPGPTVRFADFAAWQRSWMRPESLAPHLDFWTTQLAGAGDLELPLDFPRPGGAAPSRRQGGHRSFVLPAELASALREIGRSAGATPFMTLLAVFLALLHRWTGEDDLVAGCPVAGRPRPELEPVVGFFAYPLALRTDLSGDPTFRQLVGRVRRTALGAFAHQDVPFAKVVAATRPSRPTGSGAAAPLFRVMLGLLDRPVRELRAAGLTFAPPELGQGATDFDLFLTFLRQGESLRGVLGYNAGLFAAETMDRWVESLLDLARSCAGDPDAPLSHLALHPGLTARVRPARPTIAVAATFTAEPVADVLAFWGRELELPLRVRFAPYGQLFQQLLDPGSLFARNASGLNVVLVRCEDWLLSGPAPSEEGTEEERLAQTAGELSGALRAAAGRLRVPCLVCITPVAPAARADPRRAALFRRTEEELAADLAGCAGIHLVTSDELAALYPVAAWHDPHGEELGHIPYTAELFAALGTLIIRRLVRLQSPPAKVLVLDCDQTLWTGVCGEDGPLGIAIDPPRRALQEFAVALHDRGILLCLCSRNNEEDVAEVFARRTDMPLRREHITAERINWTSKAENLRSLAAELRLGLDSFVVLDDDPVVCAEMQAGCPEALVLQLPADPAEIPGILAHIWAFDLLETTATAEDRERTFLYRQERQRERLRGAAPTLADFLAGLELVVSFPALTPEWLPRVAQLTQRTNQFNTTTIRRSAEEIRDLCGPGGHECLLVEVRDRFGDYGLVGAVFWRPAAGALAVETLLLSCRALGRGVEHRLLAQLGAIARERGLARVEIPCQPTRKNRPVLDFLTEAGAAFRQPVGEGWLFALPAEIAAAAVHRPELGTARPEAADETVRDAAAPAARVSLSSTRMHRIARELATPAQILAALRAGREIRPGLASGYVAPRTTTEEDLAEIWRELLGVDRVGVHDHFFDLGGHSLLAIQILSRVREVFAVDVPLSELFEDAPNVGNLARAISKLQVEKADAEDVASLLTELDELSEEEILVLLAGERQAS
jgi:FkbH-like protein